MPAELTQITSAVVSEISGATLSQPSEVERVYIPVFDSATAEGVQIFVLGLSEAITSATRNSETFVYLVKVAIYKKLDDATNVSAIDTMIAYRQEVIDLMRGKRRLTAYPGAVLSSVVNEAAYDPVALDEANTFCSVITLEYTLLR